MLICTILKKAQTSHEIGPFEEVLGKQKCNNVLDCEKYQASVLSYTYFITFFTMYKLGRVMKAANSYSVSNVRRDVDV